MPLYEADETHRTSTLPATAGSEVLRVRHFRPTRHARFCEHE